MDLNWDFVEIPEENTQSLEVLDFGGLLNPGLRLVQDAGATGCGGKLWPAGELLSIYLLRQKTLEYKKVIELGSGTGLTGLAVAKGFSQTDMDMYITDQVNMLPLMESNIEINDLQHSVHAQVLDWGEPLPDFTQGVDLVLAADCVYLEECFPLLERTLLDLTVNEGVKVLMAYKKRRKADKRFFLAIKKHFRVVEIKDFPEYEKFLRDSVFLFELQRIRSGGTLQ